jgi:hypothetical protein
MPAGAVATLDVTFWRYCQMHPSVLIVVAAKAGMPMNLVLHIARGCHDHSPPKIKTPAGKYPTGVVAGTGIV